MKTRYDVVVIGGGPAGYTAALYCVRAGFDTLIIERLGAGGQMATAAEVENYPGFPDGIDGFRLAEQMKAGAERFGAETVNGTVRQAELARPIKTISFGDQTVEARTVVLATGAEPRHLGLPEEESLAGRGVAYCAVCDGMYYKDKIVAVVGGGNSAAADALALSKLCSKVYLVHRRDRLTMNQSYQTPLEQAENITIVWNQKITRLLHEDVLTGLALENTQTGHASLLYCDGLFVAIGRKPKTDLFRGQLILDEDGYIVADETTRTNLRGVFAVGDVRTKPMRQIITAAADGATASHYIEAYLQVR